ncbi:MAG: winged helix DNA-binding domain-containing protein [Nocardioides sp.]
MARRTVGVDERRARLAARHLLLPDARTDDVADIADALVALHSSDPVTVHLSVTARMAAPSITAVEKALYDDRSVVRHHGMRRTLWVATPDVVRVIHAAATRRLFAIEHRRTAKLLGESGVADPEQWLRVAREHVLAALHEHGAMSARRLGETVPELRQPLVLAPGSRNQTTVAAHTRVLLQLAFEGEIIRARPVGSWVSGQYTYAAMDSWLPGGVGALEEREAARALADRYLRRFGPATTADLQWWAGWTATLTRHALADCGAVPVLVETGTAEEPVPGWLAAGDEGVAEPVEQWVALLPGLDPTTMGWKQRTWYLSDAAAALFDANGNAGPSIWSDGRVVGGWAQAPDGTIGLHWFGDVPARVRAAVDAEVDRLVGVVGDTRFTVRFPGATHKALLA